MRESPSLYILPGLVEAGAEVIAYDPSNPHDAVKLLPEIQMAPSPLEAARSADLIVILTEWKQFRLIDLASVAAVMRDPVMIDLRNIFAGREVIASGFRSYYPIGSVGNFY